MYLYSSYVQKMDRWSTGGKDYTKHFIYMFIFCYSTLAPQILHWKIHKGWNFDYLIHHRILKASQCLAHRKLSKHRLDVQIVPHGYLMILSFTLEFNSLPRIQLSIDHCLSFFFLGHFVLLMFSYFSEFFFYLSLSMLSIFFSSSEAVIMDMWVSFVSHIYHFLCNHYLQLTFPFHFVQ